MVGFAEGVKPAIYRKSEIARCFVVTRPHQQLPLFLNSDLFEARNVRWVKRDDSKLATERRWKKISNSVIELKWIELVLPKRSRFNGCLPEPHTKFTFHLHIEIVTVFCSRPTFSIMIQVIRLYFWNLLFNREVSFGTLRVKFSILISLIKIFV